jgi:hypothetical protein
VLKEGEGRGRGGGGEGGGFTGHTFFDGDFGACVAHFGVYWWGWRVLNDDSFLILLFQISCIN